jgi:CRISPR-associated protein Cas2
MTQMADQDRSFDWRRFAGPPDAPRERKDFPVLNSSAFICVICGQSPIDSRSGEVEVETFLVAYDISDPRRLRKVARTCEDFGRRRQFSVFLCRLTAADLVLLKSRLYDIIDLDQDQVLFIPLCGRCGSAIETLGRPIEPHDARDVVIVT